MLIDKSRLHIIISKLFLSLEFVLLFFLSSILISCHQLTKCYLEEGESSHDEIDTVCMAASQSNSASFSAKKDLDCCANKTNNIDSLSHYVRVLLFTGNKHHDGSNLQYDAITTLYGANNKDSLKKVTALLKTIPNHMTRRIINSVFKVLGNRMKIDNFLEMGELGKDSIALARYEYVRASEHAYADSLTTDTLDYFFQNYVCHMSLLYSCFPLSRESPYYHYLEQYSTVVDRMPESLSLLKEFFWMLESTISIQAKDARRSIDAAEKGIQIILKENSMTSLVDYANFSSPMEHVYLYTMASRQLYWCDVLPDSIVNRNVNFLHTKDGKIGKRMANGPTEENSLSDSLLFSYISGKKKEVIDIAERMFETGDTLILTPYYIIRIENKALRKFVGLSANAKIGLRNCDELNTVFLDQLESGADDYIMLSSLQTEFRKSAILKLRAEQANIHTLYLLIGVSVFIFILLTLTLIRSRISKRKIAEARAESDSLRLQAEQAQEMQNHFMHNMNHEIRTPINAVIGFSNLLIEDDSLTKNEREDLGETIKKNGDMLIQIINDVLDVARLDSCLYELSYEEVKLNTLCRQSLETIRYRVPEGVELNFESALSDDFLYYTDACRLEQILLNYLSNACKHVKEGFISLQVERLDDKLKFVVINTGAGVPDDMVSKLFQRFNKLNNYAQGTGLGLNICLKLADLMGGCTYYDKTFIGGACFVCELPLDNRPRC